MTKIDGRTLDHKALEHIRLLAVKRVMEGGEAPSDVMKSLGFSRTAIYPWLRKFEEHGWDSLVERIAQGPEPKLTEKQRQQVKRWILGKDPRQYGFDFGLWSRKIVQALIQERMKIELGLTAVGRLLASLDITPQKPLRRAYERDPEAVEFWLQHTYPELKKRAKQGFSPTLLWAALTG
jgi:transposase